MNSLGREPQGHWIFCFEPRRGDRFVAAAAIFLAFVNVEERPERQEHRP